MLLALFDLEDVALGIAEVAPPAVGISVSFDPGDLLYATGNPAVLRGRILADYMAYPVPRDALRRAGNACSPRGPPAIPWLW